MARWLNGATEPRLPDFLRLGARDEPALGRSGCDIRGSRRLPSLRPRWQQQQLARKAAYDLPWSHAVLRGLELVDCPRERETQEAFLTGKLGLDEQQVREALGVLQATAQIKRAGGGWVPREVASVDTGADPMRAQTLRVAWTRTALRRLEQGVGGKFVWTVFAVSKSDLVRLHSLHLQYLRAMQDVIASSSPNECVGLYCAQLLDLADGK